jgi:hypothetical protein
MPNRTRITPRQRSSRVSGTHMVRTWPPNHGRLPSTTAHCGHPVTESVTEVMASVHTGGNPAAGEGSSDSGGRASHRWSTLGSARVTGSRTGERLDGHARPLVLMCTHSPYVINASDQDLRRITRCGREVEIPLRRPANILPSARSCSQPVAEPSAAVCVTCPFIGCGRGVAADHLP